MAAMKLLLLLLAGALQLSAGKHSSHEIGHV